MTREEAIKFLSNTKVYVNGKSKEIQEKLFSLGFHWELFSTRASHEDKPFLFMEKDKRITFSRDMTYFKQQAELREITVDDILNIVIDDAPYRPFKDANECLQEIRRHEPCGWLYHKSTHDLNNALRQITYISDKGFRLTYDSLDRKFESAFSADPVYFADGAPFGVKEEE